MPPLPLKAAPDNENNNNSSSSNNNTNNNNSRQVIRVKPVQCEMIKSELSGPEMSPKRGGQLGRDEPTVMNNNSPGRLKIFRGNKLRFYFIRGP